MDTDGLRTSSSTILHVVDVETVKNHRPVIDDFYPEYGELNLYLGDGVKFNINASDPDGDKIKIEWFVNGNPSGTGNEFYYIPPDTGRYTVDVIVSDGKLSSKHRWTVEVVRPGQVPGKNITTTSKSEEKDDSLLYTSIVAGGIIATVVIMYIFLMMKRKRNIPVNENNENTEGQMQSYSVEQQYPPNPPQSL